MITDNLPDALNLHSEEVPHALAFTIAPDRLLNENKCLTLRESFRKLSDGGWERVRATESLYNTLPDKGGIYLFLWEPYFVFDFDDLQKEEIIKFVLYIGKAQGISKTSTLRYRYENEYSKYIHSDPCIHWKKDSPRNRSDRLKQILNLWDLKYWYIVIEDINKINILEKQLIRMFNPPGNKALKAKTRLGKSTPAFQET